MSVNYNATVNILEGKNFSPKTKILIPGSGEEYGEIYKNELPIDTESILRPVNPYAIYKNCAGFNWLCVFQILWT